MFSHNQLSALEVLQNIALYSHHDEIKERAEQCLSSLFDEYDPEEFLFLEERIADDPKMQ